MLSADAAAAAESLFEPQETEDGYIIFRHRDTGRLHLHDPRLAVVLAQISRDCDRIAYGTYRVAAKVTALARALHTSRIPYSTITNIMERHRMRHTDNAPLIRAAQLTALLHDIFYAAEKMGLTDTATTTATTFSGDPHARAPPQPPFSIDGAVETLANLLWNVFDRDRNRPLSVLQLKQTFLLLCQPPAAHQDRLIHEHFLLASDHNGCVSRLRLESLVVVMSQLFRYLDPVAAAELFAVERIAALLHGCFEQCPGPVGLTKLQFQAVWQRRAAVGQPDAPATAAAGFEPYASVYAAVGRMAEARDCLHLGVACSACRRTPVRGLLFRCRQCRRVALCFECFATGAKVAATGGGDQHNGSHRMDEISSSTVAAGPSRWRAFVHKVCTMFTLCPLRRSTAAAAAADEADNITMETHVLEMGGIGCRVSGEAPMGKAAMVAIDVEAVEAGDLGVSQALSSSTCGSSGSGAGALSPVVAQLREQNAMLAKVIGDRQRQNGGGGGGGGCCGAGGKQLDEFLRSHQGVLAGIVSQLQKIQSNGSIRARRVQPQHSSTPYRTGHKQSSTAFVQTPGSSGIGDSDANSAGRGSLGLSIKGADINRSFVEANKSDLSIGDLSQWFHTRRLTDTQRRVAGPRSALPATAEESGSSGGSMLLDTDMSHFRQLLHVVRDIIDDSYSDNAELSKVTTQLERVLGQIIDVEEQKRVQLIQTTESICV